MHLRSLFFTLALIGAAPASPLDEAVALYRAKRYPEARAALEKITVEDPKNAAAAYHLGMTYRRRGDDTAIDDAARWLAKAIELEPNNPTYLADFGGTSMQLASKTRSYTAATKGRDAMIRALVIDPENLDARDGLLQFYTRAPWPLGSASKALAQAEEIRKRDPQRGLVSLIGLKLTEKNYAAAALLCEEVLKKSPDDYLALYQIGRIASLGGENIERGLNTLKRCLDLAPPPNSPSHSHAHYRIGTLLEKKGDATAARAAYTAALRLDSSNQSATDALTKLK